MQALSAGLRFAVLTASLDQRWDIWPSLKRLEKNCWVHSSSEPFQVGKNALWLVTFRSQEWGGIAQFGLYSSLLILQYCPVHFNYVHYAITGISCCACMCLLIYWFFEDTTATVEVCVIFYLTRAAKVQEMRKLMRAVKKYRKKCDFFPL